MNPHTMFGYDRKKDPVVATNATPTEAKAFARSKGLSGFFLAPHWSQIEEGRGMIAYRWVGEKQDYEVWNMRAWVFTHLLDPGKPGTKGP